MHRISSHQVSWDGNEWDEQVEFRAKFSGEFRELRSQWGVFFCFLLVIHEVLVFMALSGDCLFMRRYFLGVDMFACVFISSSNSHFSYAGLH